MFEVNLNVSPDVYDQLADHYGRLQRAATDLRERGQLDAVRAYRLEANTILAVICRLEWSIPLFVERAMALAPQEVSR